MMSDPLRLVVYPSDQALVATAAADPAVAWVTAADVSQFARHLSAARWDAFVVDARLAHGPAAIGTLRAMAPDVPLVALVADEPASAIAAVGAGAHETVPAEGLTPAVLRRAVALARARRDAAGEQFPCSLFGAALDALVAHVAVLGPDGTIVRVNQAWKRFAAANGWPDPVAGLGTNYLAVAERGGLESAVFAERLRDVLAGRADEFEDDYACHGPDAQHWFRARIRGVDTPMGRWVVVSHEPITVYKQTEHALRAAAVATSSLVGEDFFRSLVCQVAQLIGATVAIVGELDTEDPYILKALATWENGTVGQDYRLDIRGRPCEQVLQRSAVIVPTGLGAQAPDAPLVQRYGLDSYYAVPICNGDGQVIGILSVMDTRPFGDRIGAVAPAMAILAARAGAELQRMQAERELRASEERFRLVSRATHDVVWEWDLASDAVRVDAQRGSEFGLPDTLCTTMDGWMTIVHPDDQERLRTMTHAALQGAAETFSAEHRVRRKDGTYVPVATRAYIMRDASGRPYRVIAASVDLTERHRSQATIRLQDELLRTVVDHFPAGCVGILDRDDRVVLAGGDMVRSMGFSLGSLEGRYLHEVLSGEDLAMVRAWAGPAWRGETVRTEAGNAQWRNIVNAMPVWGDSGDVAYVAVIIHDITDRMQMEDALRVSESQLRLALEGARAGIWEYRLDSGEAMLGPEILALWGYDGEAEPGLQLALRQAIHPEDFPVLKAAWEACLVGETDQFEAEFRLRIRQGDDVWFMSRGRVVERSADGTPLRLVGTMLDVNARRQAEEALRASEERFRLLSLAVNDMIWDRDVATQNVIIVHDGPDLFGSLKDLPANQVYAAWMAAIHPEDREAVRESLEAGLAGTGTLWAAEYRALSAGGVYRCVQDRACIVRDGSGRPVRLIGATRDISAAKALEQVILASEERFRLVALASNELVWDWDVATHRVAYYQQDSEFFGYTGDIESSYDWWHSRIHPDEVAALDASLHAAMQGTGTFWEYEYRFRRADSSYAHAQSKAYIIRDEQGAAVRLVGALADVSERKAIERQLMLADRMVSMGMLAASVAHEINNPLAYIISNLEVACSSLEEGPAVMPDVGLLHEAVSEAKQGAERVRSIVRDLKLFSRLEDGDMGAVHLPEVLDSVLNMVANIARPRARLLREYEDVPPVAANASQVAQIVLNLLQNAIQAIPEGAPEANRVTLALRRDGPGWVAVSVSDTGAGIDPSVRERMFEPFVTTKPIGEGTGLGLAICHRLVTRFGGTIDVDSRPGMGTTFTVRLPAAASVPEAVHVLAPVAAAPARGRILVIDDEPMIGKAICRAFHQHVVTVETSSLDGLRRLMAGECFDLILCDLMMPGLTGMELYDRLRERAPAVAGRMVFLTGGAFTPSAQAFLERVDVPCFDKPFDLAHLRQLLDDRLAQGQGAP